MVARLSMQKKRIENNDISKQTSQDQKKATVE